MHRRRLHALLLGIVTVTATVTGLPNSAQAATASTVPAPTNAQIAHARQGTAKTITRATYATEATGAEGVKVNAGVPDENSGYAGVLIPFNLPFHRTEYVNTDSGARWRSEFNQQAPFVPGEFPEAFSGSTGALATYRGGRTYRQEWNRAVFGPSADGSFTQRTGDLIDAFFPLFSEGSGHVGGSTIDSARIALYSRDKLIGAYDDTFGEFQVPAATAPYRLEVSAWRSAPHMLSTTVSGVWTFRSGHVEGDTGQPLSLPTVRVSPRLDDRNAAPAGRRFEIPLTVSTPARSVAAEISYDDGHTWQWVALRGSGAHRVGTVRHPGGAGFASLRIHATDRSGNTVTQTVIRAYAIG